MDEPIYDAFSNIYADMVHGASEDIVTPIGVASHYLVSCLKNFSDLTVCDLGCGEGHITRKISKFSKRVVGVDISKNLLSQAIRQSGDTNAEFILDDAQVLGTLCDNSFDIVISNLSLMDIPDLPAVYKSVNRILRLNGRFLFTITHPCFQSPGSDIELDENGRFVSRRVRRYAEEGFWRSDKTGSIRAIAGAYHRTLSTYINGLINTGFVLQNLVEPTQQPGAYTNPYIQAQVQVPAILLVDARKI